MPLSVAMLAPCAWGENLACGVAWQGTLLGRNGAWQGTLNSAKRNTAWRSEFDNETAKRGKIQWHSKATNLVWQVFVGKTMHGDTANSAWRVWRNGRCLWAKQAQQKWSSVWVGGLLSHCSHFWHALGLNLKGFFTHFIVVSSHFIVNFSHFFVVFSRLFIAFSRLFVVAFRFIIVFNHLFTHKRHFLEHFVFWNF